MAKSFLMDSPAAPESEFRGRHYGRIWGQIPGNRTDAQAVLRLLPKRVLPMVGDNGRNECAGPVLFLRRARSGLLPETLYHRDNALLYIAHVTLIWAAPIPADRWHCSLWS